VPRTRHKTLRELGSIPDWLTPSQAAELLQVHPQTVRVWIREGRIPSQKFGGSRRIPRDELLATRARTTAANRATAASTRRRPAATPPKALEPTSSDERVVTVTNADAAQMLGISRATIERWVRAGRFTLIHVGANRGKRRIVHDERFELLLAQRNVT
jgi:excisionase family DNA binding protein